MLLLKIVEILLHVEAHITNSGTYYKLLHKKPNITVSLSHSGSSRWQVSFKIIVLKSLANFRGTAPVLESLFNKVAFSFIKKGLQRRCFPVNLTKFLRTPFFIEHLWWLLHFSEAAVQWCS